MSTTDLSPVYYVCEHCSHYFAAAVEPPDRCEHCGAHHTWLSEWPTLDAAEDASAAVLFDQRLRGGRSYRAPEPVRTMRDWPDAAIRIALVRWSGPALESARDEAAARGWDVVR